MRELVSIIEYPILKNTINISDKSYPKNVEVP